MKVATAASVVCIAIEASLVVATVAGAAVLGALFAIPLAGIFALLSAMLIVILRSAHTSSWAEATDVASEKFGVPRKAMALWISEIALLAALLPRSKKSTHSGREFSSHGPLHALMWAMITLSLVETTVVHLAIRVPWVRWLVFAVSVYALFILIGFYCVSVGNPHRVSVSHIEVKSGGRLAVNIPRGSLSSWGQCSPGAGGSIAVASGTMRVPVLSQVNTYIETTQPVIAKDISLGKVEVSRIEFYTDGRSELLAELATSL